jgi:periplasmic protein TonB
VVIRYNVPKWGGPRPLPDAGSAEHFSASGQGRTPVSARKNRHFGSGLASLLLHAAAIAALVMVVTPPLPPPPEEASIQLVFEQPAPAPAAQPEPPPPVAEAPPEPAPPPPTPEQPPPQPVPPPPIPEQPPPQLVPPPPEPPPPKPAPSPPEPVRPLRPPPKPPAVRQPPPRPVERAPVAPPPQVGPETRPPAPAPSVAAMDRGWVAAVSAWLAAHRTYPELARERGDEGNVSVRFTVDRSGRVMEAAIVGSSGSALLDEAALEMLRHAAFAAFPADMTQAQVTITTSLRYSLR